MHGNISEQAGPLFSDNQGSSNSTSGKGDDSLSHFCVGMPEVDGMDAVAPGG